MDRRALLGALVGGSALAMLPRQAAAVSEDIFDLTDFGPVGNGQDDYAAIAAAIDAAAQNGGEVRLPAAELNVSEPIHVPRWVSITGRGNHAPGKSRDGLSVIVGQHTGPSVLSLKGTHCTRLENFSIITSATAVPKTGLLLGRNGPGSAGAHVIRNVNVVGYFSKAAVYAIASEENSYENLSVGLYGGGALSAIYTGQGDTYGVDSLVGSSNVSHNFYNLWVQNTVQDDDATCLEFSGGGSSGDLHVFGAYLIPSRGSYVKVWTGQSDGSSMVRPVVFSGVSGEMGTPGGPKYGFDLRSTGNFEMSVVIQGSHMPVVAGGMFCRKQSNITINPWYSFITGPVNA